MTSPIHVLGLSGSLRRASWNTGLLRAASEVLPEGMTLETFDLAPVPLYDQDLDTPDTLPEAVRRLKERIAAADALLLATPEYHGSTSGVLKNALDWASRPMRGSPLSEKPLAIMGAGGMSGTIRAQLHLRQMATSMNMYQLNRPALQIQRAWEKFDANGNLTDEVVRHELRAVLEALVAWTRRLRGH
jgi:chromate reductase